MMAPFDGSGPPPNGQQMQQMRPPMPNPHAMNGQQGMPHQHPMNPAYGRGMPGQPPFHMQQSPARPDQFGMQPNPPHPPPNGYSGHPPLHSPHQGPPGQMHPGMQPRHDQMRQRGSIGPHHGVPPPGMNGAPGMPNMQPQMNRMGSTHSRNGMPSHPQQQPQQPQMVQQHRPPPPQQQQPPPGGNNNMLSGGWQRENDTPYRRDMIQHIVKLLKKDKQGSPESQQKLPQMAKQLEVSLYRDAPSFEAYRDMSTLKQRLQQIAVEVSRKSKSQSSDNTMDRRTSQAPPPPPPPQQQQQPPNPYQQQQHPGYRSSQYSGGQPRQDNSQKSSSNRGMNYSGRESEDVRLRIRHKQQRLLLLHHSAKCPHDDGQCPVTQHCSDMKRLWRHMERCKDNQCRIAHCFSSRAILSHYRKCKDASCPACGPVRETVRRNRGDPSSRSKNAAARMDGLSRPSSDPLQLSQQSDSGLAGSTSGSYAPQQPSSSSSRMPPPPQQGSQPLPPAPSYNISSQGMPQQPSSSQPYGMMPRQRPSYSESSGQSPSQSMRGSLPKNGDSMRSMPSGSSVMSSKDLSMGGSTRPGSRNRNDPEYQKIRHKQQRLLLLRHASRCPHEGSTCDITPHCFNMKKLWSHISRCKDQRCAVQHCLSSRYVLSHYRRCKDPHCPVCGPVRDTIRKSSQRDQASSRSHGRNSFDHPPSGPDDSTSALPPAGSLDGSPSNASSYERQPKRKKMGSSPNPPLPVSSRIDEQQLSSRPAERAKSSGSGGPPAKGSADHSLLNSFTVTEIENYLASLKTQIPAGKIKSKGLECLKGLQQHQHGWVFNTPVDPVELGLPDYFEIIKKPMDLGTVQKKLENGTYHNIDDFRADVNMTFDNAMTYNENGSVVYDMAVELKNKFAEDYQKLLNQVETEDHQRRQNSKACTLCGCEKLLFEPPVYFCSGMNCQNGRIRRNSHFYVGGNNQFYWCSTCFNELDDKIPIELADTSIMKSDLTRKKNDEVNEESWVQCDTCQLWVHQICGLFNNRQNKEHTSKYSCPRCLLAMRRSTEITPGTRPLSAEDLPRTTLSEWLEKSITKKLENRKRELAAEKAQTENISLEEATREVESGGKIIIRQVTAMDRKLEVRELMRKRYAHKNYPAEFPFRCKCIVVYQQINGVDVLLFALYLYEHGEDNPPPNQRVVYISYLDSVHFMKPRRIRTFIYHEILIAYLDYARRRGFATAHIWACPPLKGDDYIFYAKPEDQKTPRDSRLRQWYIDMLIECQRRNIVGKVTNMYDLYFANETLDATAVPYLEGDYFPGEAENIIKLLEEGGGKKGGGGGKKKKSKGAKNKGGNTGTRSTGVDEEALIASGIIDGARSFKDLDRDQVMLKLGETIQPMKDSFIVAFLNWSGAKDEDMAVDESVEKARIEYAAKNQDDLAGSKRDAIGLVRDVKGGDGTTSKVIDDDAEDLDCEFLNNRQAFLNLCRYNHYQFDSLRRAKHTSMMVLWHLHNRDAPKFVQHCAACSREIVSGKRFHCNTCSDYDLCQECYKSPNCNRGTCTHQLQAIAVDNDASDERASGQTDAQRSKRQQKLMQHIKLVEHAALCTSKTCTSSNCAKMKSFLHHANTCKERVSGGCKICKKIWVLLRIHARKCRERNCAIPQCNALREKMRQIRQQQQAMDDRRRIEMNRHMRFGAGS